MSPSRKSSKQFEGKPAVKRDGHSSFEPLEGRWLLSAAHPFPTMSFGNTIQFSQAPTAVQTGLDNLATTDGVTAPNATQDVFLGNTGGVETYTILISGTGIRTQLEVDVNGNPITEPTHTTTTFGAVTNTAVTNEITAIAAALDLSAPDSTTTVQVLTPTTGSATYSVTLSPAAATSSSTTNTYTGKPASHAVTITVDAAGNPVGNQNLPLSVIPTAIQDGLIASEPSGSALTSSSTQTVYVRTYDGVTLYTMYFNSTGTSSSITVNEKGEETNLPSQSTSTFSTVPLAAATELQTLATADGVTTSIASTQNVRVNSEANGTTIYTVALTDSEDHLVVISVDENGNPTVPPSNRADFADRFTASIFGGTGFGGSCFS